MAIQINDNDIENIRREAILNYFLYIISCSTEKNGNITKYDIAHKKAFILGLLTKDYKYYPFEGLPELNKSFGMGRNTDCYNKIN